MTMPKFTCTHCDTRHHSTFLNLDFLTSTTESSICIFWFSWGWMSSKCTECSEYLTAHHENYFIWPSASLWLLRHVVFAKRKSQELWNSFPSLEDKGKNRVEMPGRKNKLCRHKRAAIPSPGLRGVVKGWRKEMDLHTLLQGKLSYILMHKVSCS